MTILGVPARVTTSPSAAPVEVVTPILPSEAIRLGCLLAPVQAFGFYTDGDGTACVKQALALGLGHGSSLAIESIEPHLRPAPFPALHDALDDIACPACGWTGAFSRLAHLNDTHRWSRERIADWLEGLGL